MCLNVVIKMPEGEGNAPPPSGQKSIGTRPCLDKTSGCENRKIREQTDPDFRLRWLSKNVFHGDGGLGSENPMPLKITLKPHERMIIAGAAITNGNVTTRLLIENNVPILREKDILREEDAGSSARRVYYLIQLMYLDQENLTTYHSSYWDFVRDFIHIAPGALGFIDEISEHILGARYYKALKLARKLIEYEQSYPGEETSKKSNRDSGSASRVKPSLN
jgi:flagellar protein FlbT